MPEPMSQAPISTGSEAVVRVEGLHKTFGHFEVLKGIDMEVGKGEVVVIFGRSGSGKSTLLRCINFLEDPTQGTIEVAGIRGIGPVRSVNRSDDCGSMPEWSFKTSNCFRT
jgi:ABC-type histidine transport system ATPase subunit